MRSRAPETSEARPASQQSPEAITSEERASYSSRREGKQQISWLAALESRVSRRNEHHASGYRNPCRSDGTSPRRHTVRGLDLLRRVVLPDRLSVIGPEGVHHAVESGRKN